MFIQTEATPNPATLKFIPGKPVLPGATRDYRSADEAEESPLAHRLFAVHGVSGVFLGQDFITVSKSQGDWQHLKPAILGLIMDHYLSGAPVLSRQTGAEASRGQEFFAEADREIVTAIRSSSPIESPASFIAEAIVGASASAWPRSMGRKALARGMSCAVSATATEQAAKLVSIASSFMARRDRPQLACPSNRPHFVHFRDEMT